MGPIFSLLYSKVSLSRTLLFFRSIILFSGRPEDFKLNGECLICKGNDLLVGEELFQHMEQILVKTETFFFWLITKGIEKPIKCYIHFYSSITLSRP